MDIGQIRGQIARNNITLQEKLAVALDRIEALEDAIEQHRAEIAEPGGVDLLLYEILDEDWEQYGGDRLNF